MDCDICKMVADPKGFRVLYEDEMGMAVLHENPVVVGHALVVPRKHITIFEEVPDELVEHLFKVANRISIAAFDALKAFGTNIIVNNGSTAGQTVPHFMINVIPRKEDDHVDLEWEPRKANESELDSSQAMIESGLNAPADMPERPLAQKPASPIEKDTVVQEESHEDDPDDYLT